MTLQSHRSEASLRHDEIAHDVLLALTLLAIAGARLGGASFAGPPGPARDACLDIISMLSPGLGAPLRLTPSLSIGQIEGGADLAASLATSKPSFTVGILSRLSGRPMLLDGAERWSLANTARLLAACDVAATPLLLVNDDARDGDDPPPALLLERLAFRLPLDGLRRADLEPEPAWIQRAGAARSLFASIDVPDDIRSSLVKVALTFGIQSSRADCFAVAATRAHAAWCGRSCANDEDADCAVRLVLAHRARHLPQPTIPDEELAPSEPPPVRSEPAPASPSREEASDDNQTRDGSVTGLEDRLIAAAAAALPAKLLETMRASTQRHPRPPLASGRARGANRKARHGRPCGSVAGDPRRDGPLDLLATIAAAAPWQSLRRRLITRGGNDENDASRRIIVLPSDIRVTRFRHHPPATTVFAIDASGSSALHRLAEAKGAIELLLAECYVRREKVAVVAFRGMHAEVLLPPTRALARARRALSGLPGGGATPLACGIDAACVLAQSAQHAGEAVLVVTLTDGRANIDRSGTADRNRANADATDAARRLAAARLPALLIDTSKTPGPRAADLARAMNARYIPLPYAGAQDIAQVVERVSKEERRGDRRNSAAGRI